MKDYRSYDQAIIVSADGDFYSLIRYLIDQKKLKCLMVPSAKYSNLFQEFNDYIIHVNQHKKNFFIDQQGLNTGPRNKKKLVFVVWKCIMPTSSYLEKN